jgi:hypothetical protein
VLCDDRRRRDEAAAVQRSDGVGLEHKISNVRDGEGERDRRVWSVLAVAVLGLHVALFSDVV